YRPDNAMLVIAGKFEAGRALELVAKNFGPLKKPDDRLQPTYTEEPAQDGERVVTLRRVGSLGGTGTVYHIPAASHADFAACAILQSALTSDPSGRLYKALVETKKASSVGGRADAWHDPGVIVVFAECAAEKTDDVRQIMIQTLENLAENPVTDEEVARAKLQFKAARDKLFASSEDLAVNMSEWAGAGEWKLFFLHRDRM